MDSRIGTLVRDGKKVHYAYPNGYDQPAVEGDVKTLERLLNGTAYQMPAHRGPQGLLRDFDVTVTASVTVFSGGTRMEPSVIRVSATDHNDACKKARQIVRDADGTNPGYSLKFRAVVVRP